MATDTDYRKYTWRNLGQKELKEMWFAARGSYSTSNQTVSLSALGNYFGTGDFKDSILKHEGPEYLVALRYHGNGATSENPLPLTYKIDTNDERQNSNVAASITADNVVEISMATGLKVDAYRINGLSFLKNCWRNQEIADSIEQPFVDKTETVHQTEMELDLPSNMTYVKLPRYGFTNEAIEKVGVDGLFDSAKEKRTKEDAIGLNYREIDGTIKYKPGFKWGPSLMIGNQLYDTSRLKDWGFAERVPIILADTYTKHCSFHLPSIVINNKRLLVTTHDGVVHNYELMKDDILVCYKQDIESMEGKLTPTPKFFEGHPVWETPLYTWYRKEFSPRNPTHCVTDLLMSPRLDIKMKQNYTMTYFNIKADEKNLVLQQPDVSLLQATTWEEIVDEPLKAPLNQVLNLNYNPSFEDCTFNKDKTEVITDDQITYSVGAPMKGTFDNEGHLTGIIALSENIERYRTNPVYIPSMPSPSANDNFNFGTALEEMLQKGQYQNFFEWQKECCGESFAGWLDISTLPLELSITGLIMPFCYTTEDLVTPVFNGHIKEKNRETATYTYEIRKEIFYTPNQSVVGNEIIEKTFSFVNKPCFVIWGAQNNRPDAYFWNWYYQVPNAPWSSRFNLSFSPDFTNQTFFDESSLPPQYLKIANAVCNSLQEVKAGDEFPYRYVLTDQTHRTREYLRITDQKWGSFFETVQDSTMYPSHVVFILWSKSPDAYEYLKK